MKRLHFITMFVVILFLQATHVSARRSGFVTKEKKISRHFTVGLSGVLIVDNRFGDVQINTWDKEEVTVDITVTAKAKNDDKSQEILDHVSFNEETGGGDNSRISFKTIIPESYTICCNNEVKINYMINAPKGNAIDITNKFGDVVLGDISGKADIDESYGALRTDRLSGPGKQIKVAFGSAEIASVTSGHFDISFSKLKITEAQDITVKNKFGKSTINSVRDLDITQSYGDLDIGAVSKIEGSVDYASVNIDKLTKSADMKFKYCGRVDIGSIGPGVNLVDLKASYGSIRCSFEEGADLALFVKSAYSSVKNQSPSVTLEEQNAERYNRESEYKGHVGRGNGKLSIDVKYGSVTFK